MGLYMRKLKAGETQRSHQLEEKVGIRKVASIFRLKTLSKANHDRFKEVFRQPRYLSTLIKSIHVG
jgi:hypothetical protein